MAAAGLQGIWGLERLDKTGLATWKLWLLMFAAITAVIIILFLFLGRPANVPEGIVSYSDNTTFTIWLFFGWLDSICLLVVIFIARHIQFVTEAAFPDNSSLQALRINLRPDFRTALPAFILSLAFLLLVFAPQFSAIFGVNFYSVYQVLGLGHSLVFYGLIASLTIVTGLMLAMIFSASRYLGKVAGHVHVDIFETDRYACLCNMALIILVFESILLAAFGSLALLLSLPQFNRFLFNLALSGLLLMILPCFFYATLPVLIMHGRIIKAKAAEQRRVKQKIDGLGGEAADENEIGRTTLLNYYMLIDSLPEWPLGPHLHKLVFYILLPPISWALASALDQALF